MNKQTYLRSTRDDIKATSVYLFDCASAVIKNKTAKFMTNTKSNATKRNGEQLFLYFV